MSGLNGMAVTIPPGDLAPHGCIHQPAEPQSWPWLPKAGSKMPARHPVCKQCGLVRSVGHERPLPLGGLANTLAELQRVVQHDAKKITEAQRRLILRTAVSQGIDDTYGFDRGAQLRHFSLIISRFTGIKPDVVHNHLHHC